MADLTQRAKQPPAALEADAEGQQNEADRPSEWAGFIYNPYSGDLLPPEDDEDEDEQGGAQSGSPDAFGSRRYTCQHTWLSQPSQAILHCLHCTLGLKSLSMQLWWRNLAVGQLASAHQT